MADLVDEEEECRSRRLAFDGAHAPRTIEHARRRRGDGDAAARAPAVGREDRVAEGLDERVGVRGAGGRGGRGDQTADDGTAPSRCKRRRCAASGGHTAAS